MTISLFNSFNNNSIENITLDVLRSGQIASGIYVKKFETELEKLLKQENIITTNNMSSAMTLALYLSDVKPGDEVLTTSFACMATNAPIANCGAKPVWVDLAPNSLYIDPIKFEKLITNKCKAAIIYHTAGYPALSHAVYQICIKYNIKLIEDCNNALLATHNGTYVGSNGDFAVYSFYPNRQINTTEGGALLCKSKDDYEKAKKMRRFGIDFNGFRNSLGEINSFSDIKDIGWSINLNNLCSAIGLTQINNLQSQIAKTRDNVIKLIALLSPYNRIHIVSVLPGGNPSYWVFLIQVNKRNEFIKFMKNKGVQVSSLHQMNNIYSGFNTKNIKLPETKKLQETILALPCGWWLNDSDLEKIITAFDLAYKYINPEDWIND